MKVTLVISGMACGMCEAHICETIRKAVPDAKKVKASKRKGYGDIRGRQQTGRRRFDQNHSGNRIYMHRY